ncbi:MAG: biotin--[acetyl-CoA-carboxylase] ligase [Treponema sp.]|jgi:BirA family biotin operon repressor/biotin-[acetyl-CoA-carboxylase] ligase|nr:biotin--[acetyl-CoA-carboxylase] ligase [Treponema sp.]
MRQLAVHNPFNAPVYHEDTVDSTMEVSRMLAGRGEPHGTVIAADFQKAGRGRIKGRPWDMERDASLPFTILLRYPRIEDIPPALTLRAGLALSLAVEDFAPVLAGRVLIKWPNDILIAGAEPAKKLAGILAEADGGNVHIGMGVNVAQKQFPDFLRDKATSINLALGAATGGEIANEERFTLLEKILARLYNEIEAANNITADWKSRIESRLYKKGEQVSFADGAAGSGNIVSGILAGIGPGGELQITSSGGGELLFFTAGELVWGQT